MFLTPTDRINLIYAAKKLKKKSAGFVKMSTKLVSDIMEDIVCPLTYMINLSFTTGIIPNETKIAKIIPVYKCGEISKLSNCRPISLLPAFSKLPVRLSEESYNNSTINTFLKPHGKCQ